MSLFECSDSYSVGYAQIDNQHKRWFQLAHELHATVVTRKGNEAVRQTPGNFVAYTKGHFATEERLMLTHGYPDYSVHRDQHESLASKLSNLQHDFEAGRATIAMDFLQFLKVWLLHHISIVESRAGGYLNQKIAESAAGAALKSARAIPRSS
jgi:hemerythrin